MAEIGRHLPRRATSPERTSRASSAKPTTLMARASTLKRTEVQALARAPDIDLVKYFHRPSTTTWSARTSPVWR